jgi:hypothetical protein
MSSRSNAHGHPMRLVHDGEARFGAFDVPFEEANLADLRWAKMPLPRWLRRLRLKEWQAFQFGNERYFFIVALFNAKTMAIAQLKGFDIETGRHFHFEERIPPWKLRLAQSLADSSNEYESKNLAIKMTNRLRHGEFGLDIRAEPALAGSGTAEEYVSVRLHAQAAEQTPEVVCLPLTNGGAMYSHKALLPASGVIQVGHETIELSPDNGHLVMDDHKGFYPYVMTWNWVTGAGRDKDGTLVGFNLTQNQNTHPDRYNENCLWVGGRKSQLGAVVFEREHVGQESETWQMRDREGRVEVDFKLAKNDDVRINAVVVESRYRGPYGRFSGHIVDADGTRVDVACCLGMGEDLYLRT